MKISRRCRASILLASLAAVAPTRSFASWPVATRCSDIEAPEAPGKPYVFVPADRTPRLSPAAVIDLARGSRTDALVTCIELLPPYPGVAPGSIQAQPWWAVHVEVPFSRIVSGAHGSCEAPHTMVFIADEAGAVVSSVGIGQKCNMQPYDFTRGR